METNDLFSSADPKRYPDLNDANEILNFGAEAQSRVAEFSDVALERLQAKDLGEIGGKIADLITQLKTIPDPAEANLKKGLLRRPAAVAEGWKSRYRKVCVNVDRIALSLQDQRDLLMKDVEMLDLLYAKNKEQYDELGVCIDSGAGALNEFRNTKLPELRKRAEESSDGADAQAVRDAEDRAERFEKKLHDLELTRAVALQMAPQIRLLQSNSATMAEKIQASVVNTIPLWKSRMVLLLGTENARTAAQMQEKISAITNELLRRNALALKETTQIVTREAERGIVDVEVLRETNEQLIETLDEMLRIRDEGRRRRFEATNELKKLENEIRQRLLTAPAVAGYPAKQT